MGKSIVIEHGVMVERTGVLLTHPLMDFFADEIITKGVNDNLD